MRISLLCAGLFFSAFAMGQLEKATDDWKSKDPKLDKIPGISLDQSYKQFASKTAATPIIVAVLDSGVEVDHDDLKNNIWVNDDEIPSNGIDDDNNGYIDDVHGWNFLGGANKDVQYDNLEFTRIYKGLKDRFDGKDPKSIAKADKEDFASYELMREQFNQRKTEAEQNYQEYNAINMFFQMSQNIIAGMIDGEMTAEKVRALPAGDEQFEAMRELTLASFEEDIAGQLEDAVSHFRNAKNYSYNLNIDSREIIGDNYEDVNERIYGNNHYEGPDARHGTHVAGIIAGTRDNGLGMQGVADAAKIMVLRVVPDGDERDKDVANAIRYAADNGAKIINMSFGKSYSPNKEVVDAAVKYASNKGVLLIHAAGNSSKNNDKSNNFPNPVYETTRELCPTWIEVGASNWLEGEKLPADFTNYGKKSVDVFAPGVDIYSTVPDNGYEKLSGTSMASPVVAGLAALIWSRYPELKAKEVREIIVRSYADYKKTKVILPSSSEKPKTTKFKKLSRTGGIVNALNAFLMAEDYQRSSGKTE